MNDEQRAKAAADEVRQARPGWGTSHETAKEYLAAKQNQLNVLNEIRSTSGNGALRGTISDGIEAVERDITNIEAEIPTLRPGY